MTDAADVATPRSRKTSETWGTLAHDNHQNCNFLFRLR